MDINNSRQNEAWDGSFGQEYTYRNALSLEEMESRYKELYGISSFEINLEFLGNLDRNIKVLEVGSNIGNQLLCLQKLGFENLCGIELQSLAVELSKSRTKGIDIIRGSAFDLPFRDLYFDMVFTSGLLIHISPEAIHGVLDEIFRCTRQYIWGLEYYSETYTEVLYRGNSGLLWKTDFSKLFLSRFPDLKLVKEQYLKYLNEDNIDVMYLLEKTNRRH